MSRVPIRLQILKNLTEIIESVNPANGYENDLQGNVFRGRSVFGDEDDPLPMVSLLEPPIPLEWKALSSGSPYADGSWEILVQGFVADDLKNPTDPAHVLMAEVKSAIAKHKMDKGGRDRLLLGTKAVTNITIGQGSVRPADEVSARACFWLLLTVEFAENQADPYSF